MKKITILIASLVLFSACRKENAAPQGNVHVSGGTESTPVQLLVGDGSYVGTWFGTSASTHLPVHEPVDVILSGGNFSSGDPNTYYFVGGGTFQGGNGVLNFSNVYAVPDNTQYINTSLWGDYTFTTKADSLFLVKAGDPTTTYKLKKQ